MDWWSSQDPDVCSHFRDSIKMLQVLVLLVAALSWMLVFSVRQEGQVCVSSLCLSHLLLEWHWPLGGWSADNLLPVSAVEFVFPRSSEAIFFSRENIYVSCLRCWRPETTRFKVLSLVFPIDKVLVLYTISICTRRICVWSKSVFYMIHLFQNC